MEDKDDGDGRRDRFGRDRRRRERSRSRSRSRSASPGRKRKGERDNRRDSRDNRPFPRDHGPRRRTIDELMKEPQVTFGQFQDALGLARDDADAQKKYDDYKLEHLKKSARPFFDEHKNDVWFRERYHPTALEEKRNEKITRVEQATKDFVKEVASGAIAPVLVEEVHASDPQAADKPPSTESTCIYIKNIAPNVARTDMKKFLSSVEGATLLRLRVSEPMQNKGWVRLAWAFYETEAAADKVIAAIAAQKPELSAEKAKDSDAGRRPRIAPYIASEDANIITDLDLAKQLAQKLLNDLLLTAASIELVAAVEGAPSATPALKLDILCTYLRQVHFYCFYCSEQYEDDEELRRRCGPLHVRGRKKGEKDGVLPDPVAQHWATTHETKVKAAIAAPDNSNVQLGKELFNKQWDAFVTRLDEKKWQCTICGKMFMGAEFVRKHLTLKHLDKQAETQTKATDEQFLLNYAADPQRLGHTPLAPPVHAPLSTPQPPPPSFGRRDFGGGHRDRRGGGHRGGGGGGYRDREREFRDDPGVSAISSARGPLRSYVDLDAPAADDTFGDFHSAL